jgi:hypothetical protein
MPHESCSFLTPATPEPSFADEIGCQGAKSDHWAADVSSSFTRIVNTPYQVDNEAEAQALRARRQEVSPLSRLGE